VFLLRKRELFGDLFSGGRNPCGILLGFVLAFNPATVHIDGLRNLALSWHTAQPVQMIRGLRLLTDAPRGSGPIASVIRSIVRANPRISPFDALGLAIVAREAAERAQLDPDFFAATMLQESAFDPHAMSPAGAAGIAQFTMPTAAIVGVDPFDPRSALTAAARLLAAYVRAYRRPGVDAYALALAAYNAGPLAVAQYHGVPPYAETREYISDIDERLARLIAER
jgi:hypothetical protein